MMVIDVAILSESNYREKELKNLDKYQGLKKVVEKRCMVKAIVVAVVTNHQGHKRETRMNDSINYQEQDPTSLSRRGEYWELRRS